MPTKTFYRHDLDGLRGLAIALVVIYHVFVGRVSGGVDVFLLLSGYFFLGSQLRYITKPGASLNPWWPVWRTIRRLVPSLVLVVGVVAAVVWWCVPQLVSTPLVKQITAVVFYYQNVELARQSADYVAASASTSPLQHMWSMSIQGQFYVLTILFALSIGGYIRLRRSTHPPVTMRRIAGPVLIVVTVCSFVYASRFGIHGPASNYYSLGARAWELSLGGVLAVYADKIRIPARMSGWVSGLGVCMLVLTGAVVADSTVYPGPVSLLPVGGAVLVIASGTSRVSEVLSSKPCRWVGKVAYPLYLWHWPLLIISTVWLGKTTPSFVQGVVIVGVSVVLAWATHKGVEAPLQQHAKRPVMGEDRSGVSLITRAQRWRAVGGVVVVCGFAGLMSVLPVWSKAVIGVADSRLDPMSYPGARAFAEGAPVDESVEVKPDGVFAFAVLPVTLRKGCFVGEDAPGDFFLDRQLDGVSPCVFGDMEAEREVFVVGGSHIEQWMSALDVVGKKRGFKVVPLLRQGCPVVLGDTSGVSDKCAEWSRLVVDRVVEADPWLVVSNSTRPGFVDGRGPDVVPAGYRAFWDVLEDRGIGFVGVRDNPWGVDESGGGRNFVECFVASGDSVGCGSREVDVYGEGGDPGAEALSEYSSAVSVDVSRWLCSGGVCPVVVGNVVAYRDVHHVSDAFALSAVGLFDEVFAGVEKKDQR